jgi:carbonic anhydrase
MCDKANSPIDINDTSVSGTCNQKCYYIFNYNDSTCKVERNDSFLKFDYDSSTRTPAKLSGIDLNVGEVRIYCPSLHTFDGKRTAAEIVVGHGGNGTALLVCIPVTVSTENSEGSVLLNQVISQTSRLAPNSGDTAVLTTSGFNLNKLIPRSEFYFYEGTLPFEPCTGNYGIIVFKKNSFATMMPKTALQLSKLVTPSNITTKPGTTFYASSKSASTTEDDEIYISCQPVGDSSDNQVEGFQTILKKETELQNITKLLVSGTIFAGLLLLSCRLNRK